MTEKSQGDAQQRVLPDAPGLWLVKAGPGRPFAIHVYDDRGFLHVFHGAASEDDVFYPKVPVTDVRFQWLRRVTENEKPKVSLTREVDALHELLRKTEAERDRARSGVFLAHAEISMLRGELEVTRKNVQRTGAQPTLPQEPLEFAPLTLYQCGVCVVTSGEGSRPLPVSWRKGLCHLCGERTFPLTSAAAVSWLVRLGWTADAVVDFFNDRDVSDDPLVVGLRRTEVAFQAAIQAKPEAQ